MMTLMFLALTVIYFIIGLKGQTEAFSTSFVALVATLTV